MSQLPDRFRTADKQRRPKVMVPPSAVPGAGGTLQEVLGEVLGHLNRIE